MKLVTSLSILLFGNLLTTATKNLFIPKTSYVTADTVFAESTTTYKLPKYSSDGTVIQYTCDIDNINTAGEAGGYEGGQCSF